MSDRPSWLPDLVVLGNHGGDWERYVDAVYGYFHADFVATKPTWPNRRWAVKRHPEYKGKEATFWHIISEGWDEETRTPDLRRCERIRWPRPIIDAAMHGEVRTWQQLRNNETRIALATADFSYIVILADRGDHIMLWTAFPVEREHRRRAYAKEFLEYERGRNG